MKIQEKSPKTTWGLALAWYPEYTENLSENPYEAKIQFLKKYGMKTFSAGLTQIDSLSDKEKDNLFALLQDQDAHCILHTSIDHMNQSISDQDRAIEEQLIMLDKYIVPCRSSIVTTCAGRSHRYDEEFPWAEKVARFSRIMRPVADLCWQKRSPFSIENHADYFVSDLLEILRETPQLYMFLDTANALHIGEQPVKACIDAAPYVVGTHFKDHKMKQGAQDPLHYEIQGCALGDGDAELEKQYAIIMEKSPYRHELTMMFELFTPDDGSLTHVACFEKSVGYIQGLIDRQG